MSYSFLKSAATRSTATPANAESILDTSPAAAAQLRREALLDASLAQRKLAQLASPEEDELPLQGKFATAQLEGLEEEEPLQGKFAAQREAMPEEEEPLQGKFEVAQREGLEEEEPLQGKFERVTGSPEAVRRKVDPTTEVGGMPVNDDPGLEHEADVMGAQAAAFMPPSNSSGDVAQQEKKPNDTGLPDNLKSGIENLSGMSMDGVKVHYNSEKPAQLNALAYAQGTDIHMGPGQEQHLPHEAWHVVQQGQ